MRLLIILIAASLVGVGAHEEPPEVRPDRLLLASSTEVPTQREPSEEERTEHTMISLASYLVEHGLNELRQEMGGVPLKYKIEPSSKRFKPNLENDHSTKELIRQLGINKEMGEEDDLGKFHEALENIPPEPPIDSQPSPFFLNALHNDDEETATLHQMVKLDEGASRDQVQTMLEYLKTYLSYFNTGFPNHQITLYKALQNMYNEEGVAKIIAIVGKDGSIESYDSRRKLMKSGKDPTDVLLTIQHANEDVSKSPLIFQWMRYANEFNRMYPEKQKELAGWMCSDEELVNMVFNLWNKRRPNLELKLALDEMIKSWLDMELKPATVFAHLGLHKSKDFDFKSLRFKEYMKFVAEFNEKNPQENLLYISAMISGDNKGALMKMIRTARRSPEMKNLARDIHSYLLKEKTLSQEWLALLSFL